MLRCAGWAGTGTAAAVNAPGLTRAGSRRPGACLGTNIAPRSTAGTTYSRALMRPSRYEPIFEVVRASDQVRICVLIIEMNGADGSTAPSQTLLPAQVKAGAGPPGGPERRMGRSQVPGPRQRRC